MYEPINITIRVILALIFLFASTKLLTKRSLSHLTYFDFIASSILGTIAGNLAFNLNIHTYNFILALFLTTLIIMLASYISLKCRPIRKFLAGEPTIIIQNGKVLEHNMKKLNYSFDYLTQQLRQEKVFDISSVENAVLEPTGTLSIQLNSQNRPLTPKDLNIKPENSGMAIELIIDGKLIENNFKSNNIDKDWIIKEINKKGTKHLNEIAFAALATNGKLYLDLYKDFEENS